MEKVRNRIASFINANGNQLNSQTRNSLFLSRYIETEVFDLHAILIDHDISGLKYSQKYYIINLCAILIHHELSAF